MSFRKLVGGWLHPQFFQTVPVKSCQRISTYFPNWTLPQNWMLGLFLDRQMGGWFTTRIYTVDVLFEQSMDSGLLQIKLQLGAGCEAAPHGGSTVPKKTAEPKNLGDSLSNGSFGRCFLYLFVGYLGMEWGWNRIILSSLILASPETNGGIYLSYGLGAIWVKINIWQGF